MVNGKKPLQAEIYDYFKMIILKMTVYFAKNYDLILSF